MLTVILNQMADQFIRISALEDNVELTEFENELEEEMESEDKLASALKVQIEISEASMNKSLINTSKQLVQLGVYQKIPVPPPEIG
ncbi:MAG: hypothetical protein ACJAUD_002273 [Crocinitomicaceae bacterium]|jgi:hypothetical protein